MRATTVDRHFGITQAPDSKDIKLDPAARRLILDILALEGGASPTIKVTETEIHESTSSLLKKSTRVPRNQDLGLRSTKHQ